VKVFIAALGICAISTWGGTLREHADRVPAASGKGSRHALCLAI